MSFLIALTLCSCFFRALADGDFPVLFNTTLPLRQAVDPACGALDSVNFTEINTGINLNAIKSICFLHRGLADVKMIFPGRSSLSGILGLLLDVSAIFPFQDIHL